jgi:predicted amidohydrolase
MIQRAFEPFACEANMALAEDSVRAAAAEGAQIVALPEMFLTGYPNSPAHDSPEWPAFVERLKATAEMADGVYAQRLGELARACSVHLIAGVCEKREDKLFNSAFFWNAEGVMLGTYSKVHICRFSALENLCEDGDDWHVWPINVGGETVRIGIMICYDREHPESARVLMLKGADIIVVPNACGIDERRLIQLRTRAYENVVYTAMVNHGKPHNGQSVITNYFGDVIVQAGGGDETIFADLDMAALRKEREHSIWGDHYRRPWKYGLVAKG